MKEQNDCYLRLPSKKAALPAIACFVLFTWLAPNDAAAHVSATELFKTYELDFPDVIDVSRGKRRVPMKVHVPRGEGPFPVVIVSHGAGGNRDSNFAQARHLASHGYVCICLEHVGSNTEKVKAGGLRILKQILAVTRDSNEVLHRPKDVSFAIDQVAHWNRSHKELRGKLDAERVGAMGHSFGAFTTLVTCGARPALDWMRPKVGTGSGLGPDLFDKRVRCGVALSPQGPGEPFFLPTSYASIRVPLIGITGSRDQQQGGLKPSHRKASFKLWPEGNKYFVWIANAKHIHFSDGTGNGRRNLFSAAGVEDVQQVSRMATLKFFEKHLKQVQETTLREEDLTPHLGGIVDNVELMVK